MLQALKNRRTLVSFFLALCLMVVTAATAFADDRTQIVFPIKGAMYSSAPTYIIWNQTTDVGAAQVNITATDGSWSYSSGPIYITPGSTSYVHLLPASVYSAMPRGKSFSLYIENYHYTGGSYTGWSSDQGYFGISP